MKTYFCVVGLIPLLVIHNLCHMVGILGIQLQLVCWMQSCAPPCFDYIHSDDLPTPCPMSKNLRDLLYL